MKTFLCILFSMICFRSYSQDLLIRKVNIIDVIHQKVIPKQTVLIVGNKIQQISSKPLKARNVTSINARGKYLIPSLWDMHVHIGHPSYLKAFVMNGVLGIRDMGGAASDANNGCESITPDSLFLWRRQIQDGERIGPRMFISGPPVSNTGWATSINISTPQEAVKAVNKLKADGVDFIKVYEKIPLEAYVALAAAAKEAGLTIAGHLPQETVSLAAAAAAGQRSIEHIRDPLLMSFTTDREELLLFFKDDNWSEADIKWGLDQFEKTKETIAALKENQTWLVPTLTVERAKLAVHDPEYQINPLRQALPPSVRKGFLNYVFEKKALSPMDRKSDSLWWQTQIKLVKRMFMEGINILAGTDCACQGGIPGDSLHEELRLLVEAGLSPGDALQTATFNPARFLNLVDTLGSVTPGKIADLLILNHNPLFDINATRSIHSVIINGRLRYTAKSGLVEY